MEGNITSSLLLMINVVPLHCIHSGILEEQMLVLFGPTIFQWNGGRGGVMKNIVDTSSTTANSVCIASQSIGF